MAGIATGPLPLTQQQMLNEWCAVTPGFQASYTDIDPELHCFSSARLFELSHTDPVACSQHPLYKTRLCTRTANGTVCQREDVCPHAHDAAELRQQPADLPEARYAYAVTLTQPTDASIEYYNIDPLPSKNEARSELAAKCIHALGLKVEGQKLVPNDSWQTVAASNLAANERAHAAHAVHAAHAAHAAAHAAHTAHAARAPIPAWQKKQLLEVTTAISMNELGRRAAAKGYESWVSTVGGHFGAMHPQLAQALRLHYGSFRAFASKHHAQLCPPRENTTMAAPSPEEVLSGAVGGDDKKKTLLCKLFPQGACYFGASCHFAHSEADLRTRAAPQFYAPAPPISPTVILAPHVDFITSTKKHVQGGLEEALASLRLAEPHPNEAVLQIVRSVGADGIDVKLLKAKIETGLQLQRSVKTLHLSKYVRAYPEFFCVETRIGTQGEPFDYVYPVTAPLTPRGGAVEATSLPSWSHELLSPSGDAEVAAPAALADGATEVELAALERLLGLPARGRGGSAAGGRGGRGGRSGGRSGELELGVEADVAPPDARLSATPPAHGALARVAALEVLFVGEVQLGPLFMRIAALEGQPGDPPTNLRDALARLGALESMT